ncbi:AI-2E family transporter [Sulfurihydrogenibium azorense]|uniref:AI-2E family transporter n=1 Tax=Sulfurihydrogenibium azorense TaxID=309806 RepID=UPI00391B5967
MFSNYEKLGNIFFIISFLLFLFLGYVIFSPFVGLILISFLFVVIFYPFHLKIKSKVKSDILSSLISTLTILTFILIPLSLIVFFLTKEIIDLYPLVSQYISNPNYFVEKLKSVPYLYNLYLKVQNELLNNVNSNLHETFINYLKGFASTLFDIAKGFLTNLILFSIGIFILILNIFFLFKDGEKLYKLVHSVIPLDKEEKDYLFKNSYLAVQAVILGSVFVAVAQAVATLIGLLVAGIDYAIIIAFITFLAAFIPFGGASLVWIPVAIYLFATKSFIAGLLFFLYGTFVVSTVDNIVRPIVVGSKIDIHPMILFFAILGGLKAFGFLGIFIAPVIVAVIDAFIMLYKKRYSIPD